LTPYYRFDDVQIDLRNFRVLKAGKTVQVEPKALNLLIFLVENRGRLVAKRELLDAVWNDAFVTESVLTRSIGQLRKGLADDAKEPRYIETVPTRGYRFIAQVEAEHGGEPVTGNLSAPPVEAPLAVPDTGPHPRSRGLRLFLALLIAGAVLACGLIVGLAVSRRRSQLGYYRPGNSIQITTFPGLSNYPTFSPDGTAMAYSMDGGKGFEIFVRQLAPGGQEVQITLDGGQNLQPAWSPDGKLIAYYSYTRGGIWLVPPFGGTTRQLTDFGSHPEWSPDSQWIAFQSDPLIALNADTPDFSRGSTIWAIHPDGSGARQITFLGTPAGGHGNPSWSWDGKHLVFVTNDDLQTEIWSVMPDGKGLVRLATSVPPRFNYDPVYSPDGKSVLFGARRGLWQIRVSPETSAPLGQPVQINNGGGNRIRNLAFSRDGKRLLYATQVLTSTLQSLALSPLGQPLGEPVVLQPDVGCTNELPAFSPDGTRVAFFSCRAGSGGQIWLINSDGRDVRQLTSSPASFSQPAWYPDGKDILFLSAEDGRNRFFSVNTETRQQKLVGELHQKVDRFALSPDGTELVFDSNVGGGWNVWLADLATGKTRQLTFERVQAAFPLWSPDGKYLSADLQQGADTNIVVIPASGGPATQVTFGHGNHWSGGWSRDSDKILFGERPPGGFWNIWTVSRSTKAVKQITHYTQLNVFVYSPVMSPRGNQLVYAHSETTGNIWMLELDQTSGEASGDK
jgi:Tol biopolymer transport system component/DNA-binding winged helix-turn-helix (wHTH) protein